METTEQDEPPGMISEMEHLRVFLHERDVACPLCGYNLRGQTARCPECGRELRLCVGLTEPFLRAWIALAFVTFGAGGIGLLFSWALVAEGWPDHRLVPSVSFILILSAPLQAALTIAKRRSFLRLSTDTQWKIAAIAGVVSLAAIIVFFLSLR